MTRAMVVYESVFEGARAIPHVIADGLSAAVPADVVGAPTLLTRVDHAARTEEERARRWGRTLVTRIAPPHHTAAAERRRV